MRNRRGFFLFAQDDFGQLRHNSQHRTQAEHSGTKKQNSDTLDTQVQFR